MRKIIFYVLVLVCAGLILYTFKTMFWKSSDGISASSTPAKSFPGPLPQGFELLTPWEDGRVTVKAVGVPDSRKCKNQAQRKVWGVTEARKLAYIELAKAIGNVKVTSETTLINERMRNHALDLALNEFVLGARETEEPTMLRMPDGSELYFVTLEVLINGETGLNHIVAPLIQREEAKFPLYEAAPAKATAPAEKYTGLIIDARGLSVVPAMAPKVLIEDGRVVYGVSTVTTDYVQRNGLADYAKSLEKARTLAGRVGKNPLVVKATVARKNVDLIVTTEIAAEIRHADALGNFLDKCKVAFVVD